MSENKDFDSIMREITSRLTGDPNKDIPYLDEKCKEYKDHEYGKEIVRACGRLMYEVVPDEKKEELNKLINNEFKGTEAALEEIRFNIYKKNYDKALKMIEDLVFKVEDLNIFQDDSVSEYHAFDELFEEVLYRHIYEPQKDVRRAQIPYTEIYLLYGSLLVELNRLEDARKQLEKGLRWNPICFSIMSEYIETFKMQGDMETFFDKTIAAFKIAFKPSDVARCFRNLGYYFVEKQLYPEAVAVYLLSTEFEPDSKQVNAELYFINQVAGKVDEPTSDDIKRYTEKYGFPAGADGDVLGLAYTYGRSFLQEDEEKNTNLAHYFLSILYDLTNDKRIKDMIDSIGD